MMASDYGRLPVVEFLIGAKADVNAKTVSKKKSDFRPVYVSFASYYILERDHIF